MHNPTPKIKRTSKAKASRPSETQKPKVAPKQVAIRPSSTQTQKRTTVTGGINSKQGLDKTRTRPDPSQVTRTTQKPTLPLACQDPSSQKESKAKKTLKELLDSSEEKNEVPEVTRAGMVVETAVSLLLNAML